MASDSVSQADKLLLLVGQYVEGLKAEFGLGFAPQGMVGDDADEQAEVPERNWPAAMAGAWPDVEPFTREEFDAETAGGEPLLCVYLAIRQAFVPVEPELREHGGWRRGVPFEWLAVHKMTPRRAALLRADGDWDLFSGEASNILTAALREERDVRLAVDAMKRHHERRRTPGVRNDAARNSEINGADSADTSRLFRGDVPSNPDLVDLAVRIDAAKGSNKSRSQIAREFCNGDKTKAENLLRQVRRLKKEGRVNL